MIIVDSAPIITKVPTTWSKMLGDATYQQVVGSDANRVLSMTEYQIVMEGSRVNNGAVATEELRGQDVAMTALKDRLDVLHQPLGKWPLSIIFCDESTGFRKVYDYGLQHDFGSCAAQKALRERLEDMSTIDEAAVREHLTLSSNSRCVKVQGKQKTHSVQMVGPEFVAREIEWVYRAARGE